MSRCVIVSAGPFGDPAVLSGLLLPDDHIIVADGGWRLAEQMGCSPAVLVADFDSLTISNAPSNVKVITLPVKKDVTDTAEAMKIGYEAGYREFLLLGCTGGRLDHQQAAFTSAADYALRSCDVVVADEKNEICFLPPGQYAFPSSGEEKVSLFAFGEEVTGLFTSGLMYSVSNYSLSPFDPLCVSNECIDDDFCISFKSGLLMLYFSRD